MDEFDFLLKDRIQKIQSMSQYGLLEKGYVSFSGGKDSCVVSRLIDLAFPNNDIPRVYINTGIEYKSVIDFVKDMAEKDKRITIVKPVENIRNVLETYGYPFKSKEHSQKVHIYQTSGMGKTIKDYLGEGDKSEFLCPEKLKYNFTEDFKLKVSDKCCLKLKKEPAKLWAIRNGKSIPITGIRKSEYGVRLAMSGCALFDGNELIKFHPLFPCDNNFVDDCVNRLDIELPQLYGEPFNFKRTGCKGCPFSRNLDSQLEIMDKYFPAEAKQCREIWRPVYEEYERIGYRLNVSYKKKKEEKMTTSEISLIMCKIMETADNSRSFQEAWKKGLPHYNKWHKTMIVPTALICKATNCPEYLMSKGVADCLRELGWKRTTRQIYDGTKVEKVVSVWVLNGCEI